MSATAAPSKEDLDRQATEARATLERLEKLRVNASATPPNKAEQMLNQQTPPGYVKALSQSKPFSFHRFLSLAIAKGMPSECPHEMDVIHRYNKALTKTNCVLSGVAGGFWLPMNPNETYGGQLVSTDEAANDFNYVKAVMGATRPSYDPDEAAWLVRQKYVKAQSAYDDELGGSVVAPPVQGDVIPLIRPTAAFLAAGAQAMTLPPNGRFVRPRITGAPSVRALGEGAETLTSNLTTGQMELTAKKIAGAVIINEEATAFTSGTLDAISQAELGRSLGLKTDAYAFYGIGGNLIPAGLTSNVYADSIINMESDYPNIKGISANGNTLRPEYGDIFPSLIEERSFNLDAETAAWIMRPSAFATAVAARADAVTSGDNAGPQVDIIRPFQSGAPTRWRGRRVVRTTNIRNDYTKGTASTLSDAFLGIWSYGIMASYGAINFQQGHNGSTFLNGQYIIRGTMFGDVGYVYPGAFLWYPNVLGLTDNF